MYKEEYVFNFFKTNPEEMQKKTQEFSKKVVELLALTDFGELGKLQQECKQMRYSAQGYLEDSKVPGEEKNTLVNIGYTTALLDVIQMYLQKLTIQNEVQQIKTKYKNAILSILARNGTMLHKELACAIGVSASGLTAIIKQMNATSVQMIRIEEVSKFKLYTITPSAYKYVLNTMPEVKAGNREKEVYSDYEMAVRRILQSRKAEITERGRMERIDCIFIRNKGNGKYSDQQGGWGNVIEVGRKLA